MSDYDSSSPIELDDLQRSVDSLVMQLDRTGSEIADRFQSRLDDETLASVVTPTEAPAELGDQVDELIADAIDAVDSLEEDISEPAEVADQDEQVVEDLAAQVDEMIADAEEVAAAASAAPPAAETDSTQVDDALDEGDSETLAEVIQTDDAPAAETIGEVDTIAAETTADVEAPIDDAAADPPAPVVDEPESAPELAADTAETDSEDVVVATFDDASDVIEEEAAPALDAEAPSVALDETIESLDAAIESEADLVEGEFEELGSEFATLDDVEEAESPLAEPISEATIHDDSSVSQSAAPATETGATAASSPSESSGAIADEDASDESSAASSKVVQLIARVQSLAPSLKAAHREQAVQGLLLVLSPMARPLTKLDPKMRDTVGWVALNTLFIAMCLWLFLILR